jgi:hypothetical protein
METNPEGEFGGTRAKRGLKFLGKNINLAETVTGES